jgi:hypothetical protein
MLTKFTTVGSIRRNFCWHCFAAGQETYAVVPFASISVAYSFDPIDQVEAETFVRDNVGALQTECSAKYARGERGIFALGDKRLPAVILTSADLMGITPAPNPPRRL